MNDLRDVAPILQLTGMSVISLASGNKLGRIVELFIDPISGVLLGVSIDRPDGTLGGLTHDHIHSFGRDAVMAAADTAITALEEDAVLAGGRPAKQLIGTKIITESGDVLGEITDLLVTLQPPPRIIYEARRSLIDKLLGREFFLPASLGHALSDDAERLIVPDMTKDVASTDPGELAQNDIEIRSFDPARSQRREMNDDTIVVSDEDETVLRLGDDDETILRRPGHA